MSRDAGRADVWRAVAGCVVIRQTPIRVVVGMSNPPKHWLLVTLIRGFLSWASRRDVAEATVEALRKGPVSPTCAVCHELPGTVKRFPSMPRDEEWLCEECEANE